MSQSIRSINYPKLKLSLLSESPGLSSLRGTHSMLSSTTEDNHAEAAEGPSATQN